MNLMKIEQQMTMTTKEIAELTEKRHDHVMRDTRLMLVELHGEQGLPSFGDTYLNEQNGQEYPMFALPKRETLILVSGYSIAMRAKIIDRWQELEAKETKALSPSEALLQSVQLLVAIEHRTNAVEQELKQQSKAIEKQAIALETQKELNLLKFCPANAESITAIRARIAKEYGLSAKIVDAVMRSLPYSPKPAGMVQNQKPEAMGNSYAVYWTKDVTAIFKQFIKELKQEGKFYKHDFIATKFKIAAF